MIARATIAMLLALCMLPAQSQQPPLDSLFQIQDNEIFISKLRNSQYANKVDSLEIEWYFTKAREAKLAANLDDLKYFVGTAAQLAREKGFPALEIDAYLEIADRFRVAQEMDSARELLDRALLLSQQIGNKLAEGKVYYNYGSLIEHMEQNPMEAISFLHKAMAIFEDLKEDSWLTRVYIMMGVLHSNDENPLEAIRYYNLANDYYKRTGNIDYQIRMAINIGMIHHKLDQLDSAIQYYVHAESLIETEDGLATAFLNVNLGNALIDTKKFDEAIQRLKKSNAIFTSMDDKYGIGITNYHLGEAYLDSKQYQRAVDIFEEVLEYIDNYGMNSIRNTTYKDLALAYANIQQHEDAFIYAQKAITLTDSLNKVQTQKQLGILQKKYELSRTEAENEKLRHEAEIREADIQRQRELTILAVIGLVFLAGFAGFVVWAQRKTQRLNSTVQKQADKLKAINDAKSQLFANISHDFRTPLTLISGQIQLLLDDYKDLLPKDAISRMHKVSWNNNRLISLTEEIRELISLDSGNIKIAPQPADIRSFLSLQVGLFQSAAEEKGIDISLEIKTDETVSEIDPFKMEKVFYNLLSNALKFTPEGGKIEVGMVGNEQNLIIHVTDSGIGIPQEHIDHIFERYYQIESKDYKVQQGLGIGLAITKELVELHQGTIDVQSKVGAGTTFKITLPKSDKEAVATRISNELVSAEPRKTSSSVTVIDTTKKGTIMVVDDHPEIRAYIEDLLRTDFSVLLAENGWEALEQLRHTQVDLVITDIMMPVMDGFLLIESLRKEEKLKNVPVIAVSARTGQEDKERVLSLGVSDYMIKPFNSREFLLKISNLVEMRKKDLALPSALQNFNLQKLEAEWLSKLSTIVRNNLDQKISNNMLADEMAMSERTLYRVLKDLTGLTPLEFVKQVKFQYARKLITTGKVKSLNDAGKAIGENNVTRFKAQYKAFYDEEPFASD